MLYASLFDITAAIPLKTYAEAAMLYTKELILTVLSTTPGTNYENRKEVCCVKKVLKRVPITGGSGSCVVPGKTNGQNYFYMENLTSYINIQTSF